MARISLVGQYDNRSVIEQIKSLKDKVTELIGVSQESTSKANQAITKVNELAPQVATNTSAITALDTRVDTAEGDIDGLETDVGNSADAPDATGSLYARVAKNKGDIATNKTNITQHTSDISNIKTKVGNVTDAPDVNGSLYSRVAKNKSDIAGHTSSITTNTSDIATLKTKVGNDTDASSASGSLYARVKANANDIADNTTAIVGNENRITNLEDDIEDTIVDTYLTPDASTVTTTHVRMDGTTDVDSFPVVSSSQAGVMNASDYQAFVQLQTDVGDLKNAQITYSVVLPSPTPTQEQITQTFRSTYPTVTLIAGIKIADYTQNLAYQYDGTIWVSQQFSGTIPIATSTVIGGVKSSTTNGEVAVNVDGSMSLNGYDLINDRLDDIDGTGGSIDQLESEIGAIQTDVSGLDSRLDTAESAITTLSGDIAEIDQDIIDLTTQVNANATAITGLGTSKQDALNSGQILAVNSGITSDKVTAYDGYASTIAGKQAQLSSAQLNATNSGITAGKVSTYDGYATSKQNVLATASGTLTVAGWGNSQQTISVSGVTTSNTIWVSPAPASAVEYGKAGVYASAQGSGTITFTCNKVPTTALTVNVVIG